jgi:hypothetical protein
MNFVWNYGNRKFPGNISDTGNILPSLTKHHLSGKPDCHQSVMVAATQFQKLLPFILNPLFHLPQSTYEPVQG